MSNIRNKWQLVIGQTDSFVSLISKRSRGNWLERLPFVISTLCSSKSSYILTNNKWITLLRNARTVSLTRHRPAKHCYQQMKHNPIKLESYHTTLTLYIVPFKLLRIGIYICFFLSYINCYI